MTLNYESLMSYFNYSILAILVLGVIFGFFKGTFKSVYNLIVFVVLLLIGWFLSPVFSNMIINYDVSSFGLEISGIQLTTLGSFVNEMIISNVEGIEGALVEGSMLVELLNSFMVMVVRIVFLIVWLILMATIFKFIFWIVYLIIKPKKKVEGKKRKKSLASRFGGMGVSLVHSLIVVLMISIPLAGLASIGSSLTTLVPLDQGDPTELSYRSINVVYTPNGVLLDNSDITDDAILFMQNYRNSLAGKISGFVKLGDSYFDEAIFDEIISVKTNNQKIKLRYELQVAVNIYSTLMNELDGDELSLENIIKIDSDVLDGIVDDLSKLKLVHVVIPIGLEVAINSDILDEQLGEITELVDLEDLLEALKDIDYEEEINHLGKAVIALLVLMDDIEENEDGEINILSLDPDKVEAVTDKLSESEILEILGDVAISFVLNTEDVVNFLAENGKTPDDIKIEDFSITAELVSLASIYRAINTAGFTSLDFSKLQLENVTDAHINNIGDAIYSSKFFSDNTGILADFLLAALPDEYKTVITVNNINKADFISVLSLGVIMAKSGMLDDDFDPLILLTEENIEKIADYISKSDLLSENVAGLLELLLDGMDLPIKIELPDDLIWKGEDGKAELIALFTTASKIIPMLDSGDGFNFSKENVDELSDLIVDSRILMHNMGSLLSYILAEAGLKDQIDEESLNIDWDSEEGKAEFKELLNAVGIILDSGLLDEADFSKLTDGSVDPDDDMIGDLSESMSKSSIIKKNLTPIISSFLPSDFEIELFDDPDDWTLTEIDSLLRSAKILLGQGDSFNIDVILNLTAAEIDIIVSSHIIVNTAVKMLEDYTKEEDENGPAGSLNGLLFLPDLSSEEDPYYGVNGEMKKFLLAAQIIIRENTSEDQGFEDLNTISIQSISGENQDTILASRILTETVISNIEKLSKDSDLIKIHPDLDRSSATYVDGTWEDELPKLIDGILVFLGEDGSIDNIEFDTNMLLDITDEDIDKVTASLLLSYTVVSYIENESENVDSFISLPDDLKDNSDLWYGEDGELVKALKALRELGLTDFSANIDLTKIYAEAKGNAEEEVILASRVVESTIINKIETEAATGGSLDGILIIPLDVVWGRTESDKGELRKLIIAVEILIGDKPFEEAEFKVENIFNTVEHPTRQETLLESRIVEESIIQTIIKEASVGGSLHEQLIIPEDIVWRKTAEDEGELRRFLAAVEILLDGKPLEEAEFKVENIFNSPEHPTRQETLLESRIVEESIIQTITKEASDGGSLHGQLIIPEDIVWRKTAEDEGELRRFLTAVEILLDGKPLDQAEFKVENIFNSPEHPTRQETLLESRIVEESIIQTIKTEASAGGSLHGQLIIPEDIVWSKTESDKGELRRFLDAIEVILDGKPLDEAEFKVENIFNTPEHPTRQETVLDSRIVEASIIQTIETEAAPGGSLYNQLIIPEDVVWEKNGNDEGELRRFLTAIEILLDGKPLDEAEFKVENIFNTPEQPDKQETLLESRVIEASIIQTIETEAASGGSLYNQLIIPEDVVWEKTEADQGELRRFLAAIEIILDGKPLDEAEFMVEKVFNTPEHPNRQETLLESRVVEASIIKTINTEMDPGGSLYGTLVKPNNFDENEWYGPNGELVKFLASIEIIIGTNAFSTATFEVDKMLGDDQEIILTSRIVEASAIKYIVDEDKLVIPNPAQVATFYYFSDEVIVWEKTTDDIGELRRFLAGVKELIGTGTFEDFEFTMDSIFEKDFTNILPSRVLEATIAQTLDDLVTTGVLVSYIRVPDDGYHWYFHATSANSVRNGTYPLTLTTNQKTDLLGLINAVKAMEEAGLEYDNITFANINATDSNELSDALWNYSRIIRGSIATMLNKALSDANIAYQFDEDFFTSQSQVTFGLNLMKSFM